VTNIKKDNFPVVRRFCAWYSSAKAILLLAPGRPRGSIRTPTSTQRSVRTPQQTSTTGNSCSHKYPNSPADTNSQEHLFAQVSEQRNEGCKIVCNRSDAREKLSGLDDWRLMKKRMRPSEKKSVVAYHPYDHCLGSDAAQRTLNQNCIRSSKAYI